MKLTSFSAGILETMISVGGGVWVGGGRGREGEGSKNSSLFQIYIIPVMEASNFHVLDCVS